ncbi:hypothetical protein [Novosphingobium beihaiensis]|uniref:Uncharacterized protein n=1 Tax=Novosphingobium beihaiensis TaxID=2930389 RepID=A0ABT0BQP7_9SPHN|nr:hypothetical protein [Novosphingobium beihaiensis]MCJ2187375.1 hypothetical protein [Novosphingobium beihaiensis]
MLGDQAPQPEALGWEAYNGEELWSEDWLAFAEIAFQAGAFSGAPLRRLRDVPQVSDQEDSNEDLRAFSVHHLMRLFLQLDAAANEEALLFLPPGDEEILSQLSAFAKSSPHRPPLDLPDLDSTRYDSDARSITLLAFQPPDTQSIIPVRKDAAVRKYAESVMELWALPDPVERERNAVKAMREVIQADEVRGWAANAFEAVSWGLKPLSWLGVPLVGAVGDVRDVANVVHERERKSRNWLLIRTMMNDISLSDYLRRTDNL